MDIVDTGGDPAAQPDKIDQESRSAPSFEEHIESYETNTEGLAVDLTTVSPHDEILITLLNQRLKETTESPVTIEVTSAAGEKGPLIGVVTGGPFGDRPHEAEVHGSLLGGFINAPVRRDVLGPDSWVRMNYYDEGFKKQQIEELKNTGEVRLGNGMRPPYMFKTHDWPEGTTTIEDKIKIVENLDRGLYGLPLGWKICDPGLLHIDKVWVQKPMASKGSIFNP